MDVYLPIADVTESVLVLLALGAMVGFLSGLLGVTGGFLLTPLLLFIGIPQNVAVASSANQLVGISVAASVGPLRRGAVDLTMVAVVGIGGVLGSAVGIALTVLLRKWGQLDLVIGLLYVFTLGTIGTLMLVESIGATLRTPGPARKRLHPHTRFHHYPFKLRFRRSKLYISALLPLGLGLILGLMCALMGIGGGFVAIPLMIYVLGMPVTLVPGTALCQTLIVAVTTTVLQASVNRTVDVLLALLLLAGAALGLPWGGVVASRMRGDVLRIALSALILAVGGKLLYDLTAEPTGLYAVRLGRP